MMAARWIVVASLAACAADPRAVLHAQPPAATPIVAITGCVAEQGQTWMLTSATEPVPSVANGPAPGQAITGPTSGKNSFRLIGISEFDLPSHKGHAVLVKGLLIKATPVSRVNVTSVTMVAAKCAAAK